MDYYNDRDNVVGSVAIVGGGVAGITSCKSALECGLQPTVFEKSSTFGGTWSPNSGYAWSTLNTNISKYSLMFSDFPFKQEGPLHPTSGEVYQYLQDYIDHFNLFDHFRFSTTVLDIRQTKNDRWIVEWLDSTGKINSKEYEFVIIASGFFSEPTPTTDSIEELENFTGEITFGNCYKNSESFKGKRVAVVGSSFTGCEIACDLLKNHDMDHQLLHIVYRVHWILERKSSDQNSSLPFDILLYRRDLNSQFQQLEIGKRNQLKNELLGGMCKKQQSCPDLKVDASPEDPQWLVVSDGYVDNVIEKKILVKRRKSIVRIEGKKVYFKNIQLDGSESIEEHEIDHIILCTGYKLKLPFFKQNILDQLYFDEKDLFHPVVLHKTSFSPNLKNLGFVGIFKGVFLTLLELQSRWVSMVFSGNAKYPSNEEMINSIQKELENRKSYPKEQCPHGDFVQVCEDLAKEMGVQPDYERIKSSDPVLYKQLWNNFLSPSRIVIVSGILPAPLYIIVVNTRKIARNVTEISSNLTNQYSSRGITFKLVFNQYGKGGPPIYKSFYVKLKYPTDFIQPSHCSIEIPSNPNYLIETTFTTLELESKFKSYEIPLDDIVKLKKEHQNLI
eukprot:gene5747-7149_t